MFINWAISQYFSFPNVRIYERQRNWVFHRPGATQIKYCKQPWPRIFEAYPKQGFHPYTKHILNVDFVGFS